MTGTYSTLDTILTQIGDLGKYQIFTFTFVCLAVVFQSAVTVTYVFTAMNVDYRCEIPECDALAPQYTTSWLKNAVPFFEDKPSTCTRFSIKNASDFHGCNQQSQFTQELEICDQFVYETEEYPILREFDLHCAENLWKLTLVGTISNVGQFVGLLASGFLSDRFGRKATMISGLALCGIMGIIQSFTTSYPLFLICEFLAAACGAGTYMCGFLIGVELVGPKKRVLTGTISSSCYAIGEIYLAGMAWLVPYWRYLLCIIYGPTILVLSYFWIIPESVRWDLSKGRIEEAKATLEKAARINGKTISPDLLEKLALEEQSQNHSSYKHVLASATLLLRLVNCCFCWITCAFLFYGLSLSSVSLAGNTYLNFMLTAVVEIPAYVACTYAIDKLGRKKSLSASYFITGLSCIGFIFVPAEVAGARLALYLFGKFGATAAFTVCYVLTSELFPTALRHSLMGICSTFGRIGSMVAPQTPLLAHLWEPLPLIMFAAMGTIAGILTLFFPETHGLKLPDTIKEAKQIGRKIEMKSEIQEKS